MARLPRIDIAGVPQHVIQRGNNRMPIFLDDEDRRRYLQGLRECLGRFGCRLHAYVLMDNHTHLLLTPVEVGAVSQLMHTFARNHVGLFNARHGRTGTLWEGRFKACLVDTDNYLLVCHRYIELNPVRACMVAEPSEYPWSSYGANALGRTDPLLMPHEVYMALGKTPIDRAEAYRALFADVLSEALVAQIRGYVQQQRALGGSAFQRRVEATLNRYASVRPAHRPRKAEPDGKCP